VAKTPPNVEEKARQLHQRILTVVTHCDTAFSLLRADWKIGDRHDPSLRASGKIDLPRMKEGGLDAEFFAAFVGQGHLTPEAYFKAKDGALRAVEAVHKMTETYASTIGLAIDPAGARRLKAGGKLTAFIGLENGYPIGRDLSLVKLFYDKGVRYITLCHSSDNDICDSSTDRRDPEDKGLSDFGRQVVAECNRLGMLIDISHASEKSFYDVLAASKAPIIASHSSARAVCDHPRNLTDDQLRALAKNGGVIQICFLGAYVKTPPVIPEREKGHEGARGNAPSARSGRRDAHAGHGRAGRHQQAVPQVRPTVGPRRPFRPREEVVGIVTMSGSAPISTAAAGRRLRRRQRHDPRDRRAHPPRLYRPGDRKDLGRELLPAFEKVIAWPENRGSGRREHRVA
jgi:microsomal dipeptidase-like Zn-dependent dipeptidase